MIVVVAVRLTVRGVACGFLGLVLSCPWLGCLAEAVATFVRIASHPIESSYYCAKSQIELLYTTTPTASCLSA